MPPQWRDLLEELAPVFARRSTFRLFTALACGMILADRSTVTGMAAAAGIGREWRRACWFFAAAKWDLDALGLAVARIVVKYLLSDDDPIVVAVDGTFFRRWGRHVYEARWAHDGAAQGGKKIAFGNTWVVATVVVRLPFCPSPVALPALFRLWRGKGTASQVQLAAEMMKLLAGAFPEREVHGTGDAAFHGEPLVVEGTTWTTRLPSNAVLSGPKPPPTGNRGRPRALIRGPDRHSRAGRRRPGLGGCRHPRLRQGREGADRLLRRAVVRLLQVRARQARPGPRARLGQAL